MQRAPAAVGVRVLEDDEPGDGLVGVVGVAPGAGDQRRVHGAVGALREGADRGARDDRVAAGLVDDGVGRLARDGLVAARQVGEERHEVAHRPARDEQPRLLAEERGGARLELVDRGVVAEDVVAERGRGHGAAHGVRRVGDGVRAQVDDGRHRGEDTPGRRDQRRRRSTETTTTAATSSAAPTIAQKKLPLIALPPMTPRPWAIHARPRRPRIAAMTRRLVRTIAPASGARGAAVGVGGRGCRGRRGGRRRRDRHGLLLGLAREQEVRPDVVRAERDDRPGVPGELPGDAQPGKLQVVARSLRVGGEALLEPLEPQRLGLGLGLDLRPPGRGLLREQRRLVADPALVQLERRGLLVQLDGRQPACLEGRRELRRQRDAGEGDRPRGDAERLELGGDLLAQDVRLGRPEVERVERRDARGSSSAPRPGSRRGRAGRGRWS